MARAGISKDKDLQKLKQKWQIKLPMLSYLRPILFLEKQGRY